MSEPRIPFYRASLRGREIEYVEEVARSGQTGGAGLFGERAEALLEEYLGSARVLLTTSGTHALEMAALLLQLKPGDEVIVPSFSFATTAGAFHLHGAKPVFADIERDTLCLDIDRASAAISARTRAIVPVHYAGASSQLDAFTSLAAQHKVELIEDNAHGLFAKDQGKPLGTFGSLAALSFQQTKNFTAGEGGALVINDERFSERAEILREKGTNRPSFRRGEADHYDWVDYGSSYVLSDLLAAFLLAQLEDHAAVQQERAALWRNYDDGLGDWAASHAVQQPKIHASCEPSWHTYWLLMPDRGSRDGLIHHLANRGIHAVFHYLPLHLSPVGRSLGGQKGDCPVAEEVSESLVRLPLFNGMSRAEQDETIETVRRFQP